MISDLLNGVGTLLFVREDQNSQLPTPRRLAKTLGTKGTKEKLYSAYGPSREEVGLILGAFNVTHSAWPPSELSYFHRYSDAHISDAGCTHFYLFDTEVTVNLALLMQFDGNFILGLNLDKSDLAQLDQRMNEHQQVNDFYRDASRWCSAAEKNVALLQAMGRQDTSVSGVNISELRLFARSYGDLAAKAIQSDVCDWFKRHRWDREFNP